MKKFVKNLLVFLTLFFLFDKLFLIVPIFSASNEIDKRLEHVLKGEINKKIIVLGSSRGARNIVAKQLEDETDLSTFNLSYPGSNVEFHEFVLKTLIKFNICPEIVVLVVDNEFELKPNDALVFRLDRLYPLVGYNYILNELIARGEKSYLTTKLFALSRLNMSNFNFLKKHFSPVDTILSCGSMPISFQNKDFTFKYEENYSSYSKKNEIQSKIRAYCEINALCHRNNINLLVVFPPDFQEHSITFEQRIKDLSNKKAYFYTYDMNNPIYKDQKYFHDFGHLTREGAHIFTQEISNFITNVD